MRARAILITLILSLVWAALAQDANIGTWRLNEAKSKLTPGATKNNTVVYEASGDRIKVTIDGIDKNGKPVHNEWTGQFDGKDYPVTGDPTSNARSYTKIDDRTLGFNIKKDGKTTLTGRIVVSADGQFRTVTTVETDAKGKKVSSVLVYGKE